MRVAELRAQSRRKDKRLKYGRVSYSRMKVAVIDVNLSFPRYLSVTEVLNPPESVQVVSLFAEENPLEFAVPGGLIGVGTLIDPMLTRADRLVGQVLGEVGELPEVFCEIEINYFLLRRLLGVKTEGEAKSAKVQKLAKGEVLMVNIGSTSAGGKVHAVKADLAKIILTSPVCTEVGEKVALSRRVNKHWRLIGWGQIRRGATVDSK